MHLLWQGVIAVYPILVEWGRFVLPAWHTFFALGAMMSYGLVRYWSRKYTVQGFDQSAVSMLYVCCYVGGYFGARLLSIIIEGPREASLGGFVVQLAQMGPMTFYGGGDRGYRCRPDFLLEKTLSDSRSCR